MKVSKLHDKKLIEKHFRKNTLLNLYQIGDLDEFFWKYTDWYALSDNGHLKHIILLYSGTDLPVMLALCDSGYDEMKILLKEIKGELPKRFYSHLSKGLADVLKNDYNFSPHGTYRKMSLDK